MKKVTNGSWSKIRDMWAACLSAFFLLALPVTVQAVAAGFTYTISDSKVTITGCKGTDGAVTIPDTIAGLPVTSIVRESPIEWDYWGGVTSITIPNSVTNIGEYAFYKQLNLASVILSTSINSIKRGTFQSSGLTGLTIPSSVTSIEDVAFAGCSYLAGITIPASVTNIGRGAVSDCGLTELTIPATVISLGDYAFQYCRSLTNVTILSGITSINGLFQGCTSLTNIAIPDSVTSIGERAFSGCTNLASITIPNSVTNLGIGVFTSCTRLSSITIPGNVISIGTNAFESCTSLTSITIPNSVTSIGLGAFRDCTSVTNITIPASLTSLPNEAFLGCTNLPSVTIPVGVVEIGAGVFSFCTSLTNIAIPDSVTNIGDYAFSDCFNLARITIPASVTGVGAEAFLECYKLTNVFFMGNAPFSGGEIFMTATHVTVYRLAAATGWGDTFDFRPVVVWPIESSPVFTYTTNYNDTITITGYTGPGELVIPSTLNYMPVTDIGDNAFDSCTNLVSVTIPNSVVSIGNYAFQYCSSLTNVTIGTGVNTIGGYAFYYCTRLKGVYFMGNSPLNRGALAFSGDNDATIYRLFEATGWPAVPNTWGTRPTAYWGVVSFLLTINSGTGGGSYTNGSQVIITASNMPVGKAFDRWTGATQYVTSATSATTTVTMPAMNIALTATFKTAFYAMTVTGGTGGGSYTNGQKVTITATVPAGMKFDRWSGATQCLASATSSPTVVMMPPNAVNFAASFIDIQKPVLTISSPANGLRTTNAELTVTGKATDNSGEVQILFYLYNNNEVVWWNNLAYLRTTNWTMRPLLQPGSNSVKVYALDAAGNSSATNTLNLTYVVCGTLTIQTNGVGTVTRAPTGATEVGKTYTLTAAVGTGSVFSNWTGAVSNPTNKVTTFTMTSNMTIAANFTDIAKPTVVIKTPTALQKVFGTNGNFTVTGTALDNLALSNVMVSVNGESAIPASTTTNVWKSWSLPVTLTALTNTIAAYSVDTTGHHSTTVTVKCVYTETGTLNIITNGPGKVTVAPTGPLLLGKTYTLTAAAGIGGIFSNWIGDATSTSNKIAVTLNATNKTVSVTANFTDIAKPTLVITYPANKAKVLTNGLVIIRGTATDNDVLKEVKYQLYDGSWTNAASTNNLFKNWTAPYVPVAGLNTSKVYSVDRQDNHSITSTVVFTYIPGAVLTVQTNGNGTITPSLNGKVLQIGTTNTMTAAPKTGNVFVNWTAGIGGSQVTTGKVVKFVITNDMVLTANFSGGSDAIADVLAAGIVVDGSSKDWTGIPRSAFSYSSVTQEVAVALSGNDIALLLTGCPFSTSDTVLVYFKLRLTYGVSDNRHTIDLWTSGSVLYGMVDGQVMAGLEAVLLDGVLEVKIPVEHAPSQVTVEEVGCGVYLGNSTMTELFKFTPPPVSTL